MGAWGIGPYDNDDAADWAGDLDEAADPEAFVIETLQAVPADGYVDVTVANEAVAAAAWLASGLPGGAPVHPNYGPDTASTASSPEVAGMAIAALERVLGPASEWRELWEEGGEIDQAAGRLHTLADVLGSAS